MKNGGCFFFLQEKMGRFSKAKGSYNDVFSVKHWYDRKSLYIGRVAETPSNMEWFWWLLLRHGE